MLRTIGLAALAAVLGLGLAVAVSAAPKSNGPTTTQTTSINNGGGTPNCGASCDQSHNPTDYEKPCDPVPGNGCQTLPDTPCERGHGGTEIGNKHCGAGLTILKEQALTSTGPWTHDIMDAPLSSNIFYQVTVTNNTNTDYTLSGSDPDPLCDDNLPFSDPLSPSGDQTVSAGGTFVYTCEVDALPGVGGIPSNAAPGNGPYPLVNTVTLTATPSGGGTSVTLTDNVTASLN